VQEGLMPKKKFYRQRAHCNPLNDGQMEVPQNPSKVHWSRHYPHLFKRKSDNNQIQTPKVTIADVGCGFGGMSIT
jgi:tRNA (guanine-N7-)-methyltransferase